MKETKTAREKFAREETPREETPREETLREETLREEIPPHAYNGRSAFLEKLMTWEAGAGFALFLMSAAVVIWTRNYVLQVFSVAVGLLGLYWVMRRLKTLSRSVVVFGKRLEWANIMRESLGPLVLIGLTLGLYWPLLAGYMPWMGDHTVHQYKAYIMAEHLIPTGRLMGWSVFSGAGYPAGQLYPILGELWVTFIRYATFKSLSWEATYAVAFLGVLLFLHLVPYYLGRKLYGPVAGLIFGLFVMTDTGGFREGGFVFTVRYGVWPLAVGVTFSLLALERLISLRKKEGAEGMVGFAVMVMLALLAHPISLVFFFLAVPAYAFYEHLWNRRPALWLKGVSGMGLGVGLAAFWFLPYLFRAARFSASVSNLWKPLPEAAQDFVSGQLYEGAWPWALVLGFLGLIAWAADRRPIGRFLAALAAILLVVASLTVYAGTDVENWLGPIRHMQFQRFIIFIKMFLFLAAGALVQRLFFGITAGIGGDGGDGEASFPLFRGSGSGERVEIEENKKTARPEKKTFSGWSEWSRGKAIQFVTCLILAPLLTPLATAIWAERFAPISNIETRKSGVAYYQDFKRLLSEIHRYESERDGKGASAQQGRADAEVEINEKSQQRDGAFFRVAYLTGFNDHSLANGPVLSGIPQVKCSFIPSETFKYLANSSPSEVPRTPKDFQVLNVKYILAVRPLPSSLKKESEVIAESGALTLYKFSGYRQAKATLLGAGEVETVEFSDELIRLRVKNAQPNTPLVLHTAHFANWRASQGGKSLKISTHDDLAPNVDGLMKVRVSNGEVVFRYGQGALEWLSKLFSLLSLLLCVSLVLVRREAAWAQRGWKRVAAFGRQYAKPLKWAGTAFLLSVPLLFFVKWISAPELPDQGRSLTWDLSRARVYIRGYDGSRTRCRFFVDGRFICGSKKHEYVGPVSEEWGLKNRRGLWAHPHAHGVLVIEYPETLMGESVELEWGLLQSSAGGKGKVLLEMYVGADKLAEVSKSSTGWSKPRTISTSKWKGKRANVRFEISAADISARHFAFDARIMP